MKHCHACKKEFSAGREIGRRDECPNCGADLHCCLDCGFFEPSAPKQCREPVAELVKEKNKANFCDYFTFRDAHASSASAAEASSARKTLDDLFKK